MNSAILIESVSWNHCASYGAGAVCISGAPGLKKTFSEDHFVEVILKACHNKIKKMGRKTTGLRFRLTGLFPLSILRVHYHACQEKKSQERNSPLRDRRDRME